jgi:hypothetical protein
MWNDVVILTISSSRSNGPILVYRPLDISKVLRAAMAGSTSHRCALRRPWVQALAQVLMEPTLTAWREARRFFKEAATPLREIVNAILYQHRTGCPRALTSRSWRRSPGPAGSRPYCNAGSPSVASRSWTTTSGPGFRRGIRTRGRSCGPRLPGDLVLTHEYQDKISPTADKKASGLRTRIPLARNIS